MINDTQTQTQEEIMDFMEMWSCDDEYCDSWTSQYFMWLALRGSNNSIPPLASILVDYWNVLQSQLQRQHLSRWSQWEAWYQLSLAGAEASPPPPTTEHGSLPRRRKRQVATAPCCPRTSQCMRWWRTRWFPGSGTPTSVTRRSWWSVSSKTVETSKNWEYYLSQKEKIISEVSWWEAGP